MSAPFTIRPLTVADANSMVDVLASAELYTHIGGEPPTREELVTRYERQTQGRSADGRENWFNWIVMAGGRPVGYVQATRPVGGIKAEIAWVIGVPWQGRGYATAAVRLMLDALAEQGVHDVCAYVHPGNLASEAVARHLGMHPTPVVLDGETRWEGACEPG